MHDLDGLRRLVSACFAVLRRDGTWAGLACFVSSAEAAKKRFRRWAKTGAWGRLMAHSQPVAGLNVLPIDSTGDFAKRNADIRATARRQAPAAAGGEAVGQLHGGLGAKHSFVACDNQGSSRAVGQFDFDGGL